MQAKAAQPSPVAADDTQTRNHYLSALAELSRSAIVAPDTAHLLPRARELITRVLGAGVDVDRLLDQDGKLQGDSTSFLALPSDDREFVMNVALVLGLLSQQRDRDRRAMAEAEGRFGRIFQDSPVALAISSMADGRVHDVNERWLSVFGFERSDVIGRTNADLRISEGLVDRDEIQSRASADGVMREVEMRARTKSGRIIDINASAVPIDVPGNPQEMWLSAVVDVTDRKHAAAERDQLLAREQLARAEAEQALEKLRAVYAITDSVPGHSPVGDLLSEVLRRLRRTLQIDHATVLLLDDDRKALRLRAIEGPEGTGPLTVLNVPLGVGVSGRVAAEDRPMIVNDYQTLDTPPIRAAGIEATASVMAAPFHIGDRVAGVVAVSTLQLRQFTEEELRLLVLAADRVGPAIERGRLIDRIRSGMERQRALSRRLLTAHEEERRRLAVELHDELGQVLTAVKINLESLAQAKTPAGTFATMAATIQSVDEALLRVRDLALDLRPSVLDDLGLAAAIRWYVDRFARGGPIETHLSIDVLPALEPEVQTACFRVAQEALTNVDRHARAQHAWIDLHVLDGALELSVRDDGIGFDVTAARARAMRGTSVGLLGMQERVSLVDGEYEVVRVPAGGTEVRARFPLTAGTRS
jgi:PAS domain S-box-containing protein